MNTKLTNITNHTLVKVSKFPDLYVSFSQIDKLGVFIDPYVNKLYEGMRFAIDEDAFSFVYLCELMVMEYLYMSTGLRPDYPLQKFSFELNDVMFSDEIKLACEFAGVVSHTYFTDLDTPFFSTMTFREFSKWIKENGKIMC